MRYQPVNKSLFINNRKKLSSYINPKTLAIVNSNDEMPRNGDQYYPYRQNSDLFYLTGIEQEKTMLVLFPDHPDEKDREMLFIRKPDKKLETWFGHKLTKDEARNISGILNIRYLEDFESSLDEMMTYAVSVCLNSNEYPKFKPEVESRDLRMARDIQRDYPAHRHEKLAPLITGLRMQKENIEIDLVRKACDITAGAFQRILSFVKPGVKEFEVEAEIIHEFVSSNASGPAYSLIIAGGINACTLHYIENKDVCKDGDLLLMDFGAEYANYAADCTRTIPVSGKFTERQRAYYDAVLRVQHEIMKQYVVGNTIDNINKEVVKLMESELLKLGLITAGDIKNEGSSKPLVMKFMVHGIAHFLGLDVHDVGSKYEPLKPGMILTCEPGLYIPAENTGIRIENDILITNNGPVNLMEHIPSDPEEIERLMGRREREKL